MDNNFERCCRDCSARYVCRCLRVTEEALIEALRLYPVETVQELRRITGAGDGCTCCHPRLRQFIERYSRPLIFENHQPATNEPIPQLEPRAAAG